MSAADEITQAIAELRSGPAGFDVNVPSVSLPADIAESLACWLTTAQQTMTRTHRDPAVSSFQRGALRMARAVLGVYR